jgi:hypothetical protein
MPLRVVSDEEGGQKLDRLSGDSYSLGTKSSRAGTAPG